MEKIVKSSTNIERTRTAPLIRNSVTDSLLIKDDTDYIFRIHKRILLDDVSALINAVRRHTDQIWILRALPEIHSLVIPIAEEFFIINRAQDLRLKAMQLLFSRPQLESIALHQVIPSGL